MKRFMKKCIKDEVEGVLKAFELVSLSGELGEMTVKLKDEGYGDKVELTFYDDVIQGINYTNGTTAGIEKYFKDMKNLISLFEEDINIRDKETWKELEKEGKRTK